MDIREAFELVTKFIHTDGFKEELDLYNLTESLVDKLDKDEKKVLMDYMKEVENE